MPQELQVVRCYACQTYQVEIVKKSKKWQCKICNEKQSLQTVYFRGGGAECRNFVQSENLKNANSADENFRTVGLTTWGLDCDAEDDAEESCDCRQKICNVDELTRCLTAAKRSCENKGDKDSPSFFRSKRLKVDERQRITRSAPINRLSHSDDLPQGQTFSQRSAKSSNKWNKYLDDSKTETIPFERQGEEKIILKLENNGICNSPLKFSRVDESPSQNSTPSGAESFNNFLETVDDDFDLELDF